MVAQKNGGKRLYALSQNFNVFLIPEIGGDLMPKWVHTQKMYATYSDCSCSCEIKFITILSSFTILFLYSNILAVLVQIFN